ncbi:MAG: riboflavin kinase [Sphaerochaetaceae bacterium]|nr:riboflavin kinase [Sphaerochaetaceae bacterium]
MLYEVAGTVIHGKGLGHRHGMPTANLDIKKTDIPYGVYAGVATVNGKSYYCVTNVGTRPSVDDSASMTLESLLLNFTSNIYGEKLSLRLFHFLRPIKKFSGGIDEVKKQLEQDVEAAIKYFKDNNISLTC